MGQKSTPMLKIAIFLATLGICGGAGWHWFSGTPRYSLMQLRNAVKDNNLEEIDNYVDRKAVSGQIVDIAVETAIAKAKAQSNDELWGTLKSSLEDKDNFLGSLGATFGKGLVKTTLRPVVEEAIKLSFQQMLEESSRQEDIDIELVSIKPLKDETATATFDISSISHSEQLASPLVSLVLRQQSNRRWKIIGLSEETADNLADLANK